MIVNENSWHYKWWNLTYIVWGKDTPTHTNLCRYVQRMFWATLGTILLYGFIAAGICFSLGQAAMGAWHHPLQALAWFGGIVGIVAVVFGFFMWLDSDNKELADAWVQSKTHGICPLIQFTKGPITKD